MVGPTLKATLDRIGACALDAEHDELARNLRSAYAAAYAAGLSPQELCDAAVTAPAEVWGAIRNRLLRMGREGLALGEIDALALCLMAIAQARVRIDALLSHIYPVLSAPTRQELLERWRNRGTRGATVRWLKAIADDELLFSADLVFAYWRQSGDRRAAKLLAYRAEPSLLADILPELIERSEEGWIVSRAVLRANSVSEDSWAAIRAKFPATYAYLCAKKGRSLSEQEAFAIVEEEEDDQGRGLAIWAIGALGMVSVLDRIWAARSEFRRLDQDQLLERLGITLADDTDERFANARNLLNSSSNVGS